MEKVFLLNVKKGDYIDYSTHTIIFADEEKAKNVLKVVRDKFVAEREETIANGNLTIGYDEPKRFTAQGEEDGEEEVFFIEVIEQALADGESDEDIFEDVSNKLGYWDGEFHI